ncbi:MAG: hypothetical protein M1837_002579 [Sclerophora amabilis]|nr:MAG: hypothetical protein M1837_002579 [Sclerophora amabilis]
MRQLWNMLENVRDGVEKVIAPGLPPAKSVRELLKEVEHEIAHLEKGLQAHPVERRGDGKKIGVEGKGHKRKSFKRNTRIFSESRRESEDMFPEGGLEEVRQDTSHHTSSTRNQSSKSVKTKGGSTGMFERLFSALVGIDDVERNDHGPKRTDGRVRNKGRRRQPKRAYSMRGGLSSESSSTTTSFMGGSHSKSNGGRERGGRNKRTRDSIRTELRHQHGSVRDDEEEDVSPQDMPHQRRSIARARSAERSRSSTGTLETISSSQASSSSDPSSSSDSDPQSSAGHDDSVYHGRSPITAPHRPTQQDTRSGRSKVPESMASHRNSGAHYNNSRSHGGRNADVSHSRRPRSVSPMPGQVLELSTIREKRTRNPLPQSLMPTDSESSLISSPAMQQRPSRDQGTDWQSARRGQRQRRGRRGPRGMASTNDQRRGNGHSALN